MNRNWLRVAGRDEGEREGDGRERGNKVLYNTENDGREIHKRKERERRRKGGLKYIHKISRINYDFG